MMLVLGQNVLKLPIKYSRSELLKTEHRSVFSSRSTRKFIEIEKSKSKSKICFSFPKFLDRDRKSRKRSDRDRKSKNSSYLSRSKIGDRKNGAIEIENRKTVATDRDRKSKIEKTERSRSKIEKLLLLIEIENRGSKKRSDRDRKSKNSRS